MKLNGRPTSPNKPPIEEMYRLSSELSIAQMATLYSVNKSTIIRWRKEARVAMEGAANGN